MSDVWGVENFENEGAQQYLQVLSAKLVATVHEIFMDPERLDLDEDGEAMFMPSIELLAMLCERYNIEPPKPSTVLSWQEKYLEVYDQSIDQLNQEEQFKTDRRKVIGKTFHWLMSLSESYWA